MWVDIGGCRTGSEEDDGGYMYHLHLGVIRVCAIRSVACAGRRRRRRWRLTHLAAAVVDILARTDQQGSHTHTHTHVSPSRATVDANLAPVRSRNRVVAGGRKVSRKEEAEWRIAAELRRARQPATKKGLRHRASRLRRRDSTVVVVGALGSLHREWREVAKEAVN